MAGQEEFLRRFLREAKAAAKLEHPHIVQVMNVGRKSGDHFIIMQLVEGESLGQKVAREEALPVVTASRYIAQAASALGFAHSKGITHRDVKPDNILLGRDDQVKVTDFGLAGRIDQRSSITNPDKILGTPYFMSPEQCKGEVANAQSDIYSLGATFFFILTGTYPFQGDTAMSTLMKHINEPVIPPHRMLDDLPRTINDLIVAMMEKSPADRPPTMEAVRAALGDTAGETEVTVGAPAVGHRRSRPTAVIAGSTLLVLGLAALLVVLFGGRGGSSEAAQAFRKAEAYAREHPASLADIAKTYRKVAKAHPDTPEGREAAKAASSYDKKAKEALAQGAKSAADRGEALYRKRDFPGARKALEGFARKAPKKTDFGDRFRALLGASRALERGASLSEAMQFEEAVEALVPLPGALAETEYGRDVVRARETARARADVLARGERFASIVSTGLVEEIPRFLSRKRESKESELLVTAAKVIHGGVEIENIRILKIAGRGKKITMHFRVQGKRKGSGEPIEFRDSFHWIPEDGTWVLEAGGRADRWITMAMKIRIEEFIKAINAADDARITSFIRQPQKPNALWRIGMQKFFWELRALTRLMKVKIKEVPLEECKVDYRKGIVTTTGYPVLSSPEGEARSDKIWLVSWMPIGDTFLVIFVPKTPRNPRKK
jgi:hypothetical protein